MLRTGSVATRSSARRPSASVGAIDTGAHVCGALVGRATSAASCAGDVACDSAVRAEPLWHQIQGILLFLRAGSVATRACAWRPATRVGAIDSGAHVCLAFAGRARSAASCAGDVACDSAVLAEPLRLQIPGILLVLRACSVATKANARRPSTSVGPVDSGAKTGAALAGRATSAASCARD